MNTIRNYILEQFTLKKIDRETAKKMLLELEELDKDINVYNDIAIIGIACKFPEAKNSCQYWNNIVNGKNCIGKIPENRVRLANKFVRNKDVFSKPGGYLDEIEMFDPLSYGLTENEAIAMDPIQRKFLETVWDCIEDSGISIDDIRNSRTGVFVGRDHTNNMNYQKIFGISNLDYEAGSWAGILASRASYLLNLRGPSIVIDTACSSGMVSIYTACQELRSKKCDMAIAGGISIEVIPTFSQALENFVENGGTELSAFDRNSKGTIWSEGVGAVLLKPLKRAIEDRNNIYSVIKGISINNDGQSNGILSPNSEAQEDVIVNSWEDAGIDPEKISYIEAHGTGTKLGDPIEIKGLTAAFRRYTDKKQFCAIGTVKSNIGHTQAASGIAAIIKVALAIKNGVIPPNINFDEVNPYIKFYESPVYVNDRLIQWKSNGEPKTAGISSYGFSGTNCHLVLQEYQRQSEEMSKKSTLPQIFTLSARDEKTLIRLVKIYSEYIKSNSNLELLDLCFTLNIGRIHFSHRIAFLVKDKTELMEKLSKLCNWQGGLVKESQIYYSGNLTKANCKSQYKETQVSDSEKTFGVSDNIRQLEEMYIICEKYICGENIDWKKVYHGVNTKRISLPGYPVDKVRLWPELENQENGNNTPYDGEESIHPLVNKCIFETLGEKVFLTNVNAKDFWVLKEHKVAGNYTMPGTAYIDMIRAIIYEYYDIRDMSIDLKFTSPLMLKSTAENRELHIVTRDKEEFIEFNVISRNSQSKEMWIEHVRGEVHKTSVQLHVDNYDIKELLRKLYKVKKFGGMGENSDEFEFGSRWDSLKQINYYGDEYLVYINISEKFNGDIFEYMLHPALMDIAANTVARVDDSINEMYLPMSYKGIKVYSAMPKKFYSYVKSKNILGTKRNIISYNLCLIDEFGHIFAEVEEYSIGKVQDINAIFKTFNNSVEHGKFFQTVWDIKEASNLKMADFIGVYLVFKDKKGMGEKICRMLRNEGKEIIEVEASDEYRKISNNSYTLGCSQKDYDRLVEEIGINRVSTILHLFALDYNKNEGSIDDLDKNLQIGVYSLFYLTKSVLESRENDKIRMVLVAENVNQVTKAEDSISPCNAGMFGLSKVFSKEYPKLKCRCIDIESFTTVQELFEEIKLDVEEYQIALRSGFRYVEKLREYNTDGCKEKPLNLKSEGIYVITGGTGGLGLEMAKYLAKKGKVNMALINRSILPPREKWKEIIEESNNGTIYKKLSTIMEIEAMGSSICIESADVADICCMKTVFGELKEKYGKINGIIHCAGMAGEGFLIRKSEEKFRKVIAPKIHGTWILNKLTEHEVLDFFVMFSSLIGVFGMVGSADYGAANSYLDAFSIYRSIQGKRTLTIDWPGWSEVGMAFDFGVGNDEDWVFNMMNTAEAVDAFNTIINKDISRILVGEINNKALLNEIKYLPLNISEELLLRNSNKEADEGEQNKKVDQLYEEAKDELESKIQKIFIDTLVEELGLDRIGVNDSYFEIGGNSLLSMKLEFEMEKNGFNVSSSDIHKYKTIRNIAEYLREKL